MFRFGVKNRGFGFRVALALGIAFATILAATPAQAYIAVARTTYIVQVKLGTSDAVRAVIGKLGETPHDELTEVMDGFVLDLTEIEAATLRSDANVIQVVADQSMSLLDSQSPAPSWGLDRVDQDSTTYDNTYNYPSSAGAGVRVYIVDTGVMASDPDFAGRIETGFDALGQNLQGADCQGHGTHVAGTVAGTKYGVAKKATIVPVRVLGCTGSGSWSGFISAMDWIIANHPAGTPGVMSASLGGGKYQLVNDAVQKLYAAGITPVIAAGNSGATTNPDACNYSPASTPNAITVGATDSNDNRASFSNFGDCVDVFAPGVNIMSNNYLDSTTGRSLSGTSMATPHISGLAALYLADHRAATPSDVTAAIQAGAQAGKVVDAKSANGNYLMNIKFTNAALPPVGAPTAVTASAITANSANISWTAPAGTQAANSYKVEYRDSATTTWTSVDAATTSTVLTGLVANSTYVVRVLSIAGSETSPASGELIFSTLADVPDAPTNLRVTGSYGSQISLAWDAPANANGSKLTGYEVWVELSGVWTKKVTTGSTIANVTGLLPNTTYSIRAVAVNIIGSSQATPVLSATTTTATPALVTLTTRSNLTANGVIINFNPVAAIDPATPIVYSAVVTNTANNAVVGTYRVSTPSVTLTNLTRYTIYSVVVTAYSGTIAGPPSNPYTFRTLADVPSVPTGVTAQRAVGGQVNITWTVPSDNGGVAVTGYKIEQFVAGTWNLVATNAYGVNNLLVAEPAPAASEQYRVSATNSIGTGPAALVTVVGTVVAPQPPTNLALSQSTSAGFGNLTWAAPTNNGGAVVSSYTVVRSLNGGSTWTNVATNITALTASVALPLKGVTYLYSVLAVNSAGSSARADGVSYTTSVTVPAAPTMPALSFNTDGTLKVVWAAPSDNGGSPITGYKVQRLVGINFETVATSATTTVDLARDAVGASYSIRVIATNSAGDSLPSGVALKVVPAALSSAPLNLASSVAAGRLVLAWQAPESTGGAALIGYGVQYSANAGGTWLGLTSTTALTVSVALPPKGTSYQYRVYAINPAGNSLPSNVVTFAAQTTAPGAPTMRSIAFATDTNLFASWNAPSDNGGSAITGYRVEYSTDGLTFTTLSTVASNVFSVTVPREAPGVRAYVRVFAISALGESPASSAVSLLTPFVKASAPRNLTAVDTGSVVALAWAAPENLGGSTSVTYTAQVSTNGGTSFMNLNTTSGLTINVSRPIKGSTAQYRVVANTAFGLSEYSTAVSVTVAATAPSAPRFTLIGLTGSGSIDIRWAAPSDNGGSTISGYLLEKSFDQSTWSTVANTNGTTLAFIATREAAGVRVYYRVAATNASATSPYSIVGSLIMPLTKPTAPRNFALIEAATTVTASWTAPENLGGSATASYTLQVNRDNAASWLNVATISGLSITFARPAKGSTYQFRVVANTQFGQGDFSDTASITVAATLPNAPAFAAIALNTATSNIDLRWYAPSDNGGSAVLSYILQKSLDQQNWSTVATASGATSVTASVARELPGVRVYFRLAAVTAIGTSPFSPNAIIQMPYVQATAPQNFAATDNGSYVVTSWSAPENLGGSTSLYYNVQYSLNGGSTWITYVSTTAVVYNVPRPAKGTTTLYRVTAITSFGWGVSSQAISITAPTTAPSAPSVRSYAFNSDLTSTLTFNGPSDVGGTPVTGYIVEQSTNGTTWSQLATVGAAGGPVLIAKQDAGVRLYVRVFAVNSVGTSAPSTSYSLQSPYVQASAVRTLTAVTGSTYVSLAWAAPSYLGGVVAASGYQIETSADGVTWTRLLSTTATAINISKPAKGTTLNYRVLALTSWGLGLPSNTVSSTTATTVTSSVTNVVVTRLTSGEFNISFRQPTDLGGISTWMYKLQLGLNGVYTTVQTGAGAAVNNLTVASPGANVYVYYRIIATNSIGDSTTYTIGFRG